MKENLQSISPKKEACSEHGNAIQSGSYTRWDSTFYPLLNGGGSESLIHSEQKRRLTPSIWEVRDELRKHGFVVLPIKTGCQTVIDLIAWDTQTIYGIAVRRVRKDMETRELMIKYYSLFQRLRTLAIPSRFEIQLWICIRTTFRVYNVLSGGLMRRTVP